MNRRGFLAGLFASPLALKLKPATKAIQTITVTNAGSGYALPPTISIAEAERELAEILSQEIIKEWNQSLIKLIRKTA